MGLWDERCVRDKLNGVELQKSELSPDAELWAHMCWAQTQSSVHTCVSYSSRNDPALSTCSLASVSAPSLLPPAHFLFSGLLVYFSTVFGSSFTHCFQSASLFSTSPFIYVACIHFPLLFHILFRLLPPSFGFIFCLLSARPHASFLVLCWLAFSPLLSAYGFLEPWVKTRFEVLLVSNTKKSFSFAKEIRGW